MPESTPKDDQYRAMINNIANDFMMSLLQNPNVPANSHDLPLVAVQHAEQVIAICNNLYHPDNKASVLAAAN